MSTNISHKVYKISQIPFCNHKHIFIASMGLFIIFLREAQDIVNIHDQIKLRCKHMDDIIDQGE